MPDPFCLDGAYAHFPAVCGMDEAGRGCLAGPVVVASVTWTSQNLHQLDWFQDLGDSKLLNAATRERLFPHILTHAQRVRVAVIDNIVIDYLNILRATLHGFELVAPAEDPCRPILIDGNQKPPSLPSAITVVKGDTRISSVSAAAVVAKVIRDGLLAVMAFREPGFRFDRHKGYGTAAHRGALSQLGPTRYHRKSFRPLRETLPDETAADRDLLAALAARPDAWENWNYFRRHYHRFSSGGARKIITRLQDLGVPILPTIRETVPNLGPPS